MTTSLAAQKRASQPMTRSALRPVVAAPFA
jgi:hypothetical protein